MANYKSNYTGAEIDSAVNKANSIPIIPQPTSENVGKVLSVVEGAGRDANPQYGLVPMGGGGSGAVDSVNGKTGDVVLDAEDVGAAPADVVYTKTEIDQKLVGAMRYKGIKATTDDLPSTGNTQGDVWHITADGSEWVWNGSAYENLGGNPVDISLTEIANIIDSK